MTAFTTISTLNRDRLALTRLALLGRVLAGAVAASKFFRRAMRLYIPWFLAFPAQLRPPFPTEAHRLVNFTILDYPRRDSLVRHNRAGELEDH